MKGIKENDYFYFVHSFVANTSSKEDTLAYCDYGGYTLTAIIKRDQIMGCQFHPEKSGKSGLRLLKSFVMASKLLIIGYGNIAKRHLKILNKLYPTSHIGLLRHKKYYSQNIIGVNEIFYDLKKALKFEPDLVVFCNPASKE